MRLPEAKSKASKLSDGTDEPALTRFMSDITEMFREFKSQQEEKYDQLLCLVSDIRSSLDYLAGQHEDLIAKVEFLETERRENLTYISNLERKIEHMEQSNRSTCIEIRNVPTVKSENKNSLLRTVIDIGNLTDVPIQARDVKDVFRIKSKDATVKTIIVDFTTVLLKEDFLQKFRNHNKNSSQITTEHLKISGPAKKIFVSENLSAKNKRLFFLARDAAKTNQFEFCWISHGKIFVREKSGSPHFQIKTEADLANIVKSA